MQCPRQPATKRHEAAPTILILGDRVTSRMRLPLVLRAAGFHTVEMYPNAELDADAAAAFAVPDLIVLSLEAANALERVRGIRAGGWWDKSPILGIVDISRATVERDRLQALGFVGLVHSDANPDHIVFRIDQIVRAAQERRSHERVGTVLPVDLEADGALSTEFVVSLSARGAGVASSRRLEPNTDVTLTFLDDEFGRLGPIQGRVSRLAEMRDCLPGHRLGVVFYPLPAPSQKALEAQVRAMLGPFGDLTGS